jgi:hypothetical protein
MDRIAGECQVFAMIFPIRSSTFSAPGARTNRLCRTQGDLRSKSWVGVEGLHEF